MVPHAETMRIIRLVASTEGMCETVAVTMSRESLTRRTRLRRLALAEAGTEHIPTINHARPLMRLRCLRASAFTRW